MKKIILTLAVFLTVFSATTASNAAILKFDDVTTDSFLGIPNGYGNYTGFSGFDWGNGVPVPYGQEKSVVMHYTMAMIPPVAIMSGQYAGVINMGNSLIIKPMDSSETFTFNSTYFTAINGAYSSPDEQFNENLITLNLKAYNLLDEKVFEDSIQVSNKYHTLYKGLNNYKDIARLELVGLNPTMINPQVFFDDFTYNEAYVPENNGNEAPAPEPSSLILGLMGISSLVASRKNK